MEKTKNLKTKAAQSVFYLTIKRILLQFIFTITNIFLARLLFPADFGTYATIQFILTIILVFGDLGLGAALIQKKNPIVDGEIYSAFTVQCLLNLTLAVIVYLFAPLIASYFGFSESGANLLRISSIGFVFFAVKMTKICVCTLARLVQEDNL